MWRERVLKVVLVLVGLLFLAGVYPIVMYLWRPGNESPGDAMMLSLYVTLGVFLLSSRPQPVGQSQPDRLHSLVELCSWRGDGGLGIPDCERMQRSADRSGCARCHRCSPDRAGSGEGLSRAAIASRCVGRTLEKQALSRTGSAPPTCVATLVN